MKEMGGGGCGEFRAVQELTGAMQEAFLCSGHFIVRGPEGRLPLFLLLSRWTGEMQRPRLSDRERNEWGKGRSVSWYNCKLQ